MSDKLICIILARGGSKRIPKKNIKLFNNEPVIKYSINAAVKSNLFDEVMVSTDHKKIAEISKSLGASVPFFRSKKNSDDFSTTFDVFKEVITKYNHKFKYACCLYSCAPFVTSALLKKAYKYMIQNNFDCIFPVVKYSHPIQRALKIDGNNILFCNPENIKTRTQDLDPRFHDTGQFYFLNIERCLNNKSLMSKNTGYLELNDNEVQDIDNLSDWKLAELKYEILQKLK